ncbi:MAG: sulfite reductase subunit A [Chlamydiae bacterium]|nr:sulfite reductase subunit A [Chlamydiota bacterium]
MKKQMKDPYFYCSLDDFRNIIISLSEMGYEIYGPKMTNQAITLGRISSDKDLPIGWADEQSPGKYNLKKRDDLAYFGYNLGPDSWKKYLFPPKEKLFTAVKQHNGLVMLRENMEPTTKMAFLGMRSCEIEAMFIQDKVFMQKQSSYDQYAKRRESLFVIAVQCTRSVSTCFCTTMECGPKADNGFDIALTEVISGSEHYFLLEVGSSQGDLFTKKLGLKPALHEQIAIANTLVEKNASSMQKKIGDTEGLHDMLLNSYDCKRWDNISKRCVNCANCTMVCPTCFCSAAEDVVSLDGNQSERWQSWESCFTLSHSHIHGGSVRQSASSRYRQWLIHKFGTWWDQFGSSGCTGCGRCITWCPVGIDVTEEIQQIQKEQYENNQ